MAIHMLRTSAVTHSLRAVISEEAWKAESKVVIWGHIIETNIFNTLCQKAIFSYVIPGNWRCCTAKNLASYIHKINSFNACRSQK